MLTFSQNVSSVALTVWDRQCFEDTFTKDQSVTQLINYKGFCRTVPATPGLLTISSDNDGISNVTDFSLYLIIRPSLSHHRQKATQTLSQLKTVAIPGIAASRAAPTPRASQALATKPKLATTKIIVHAIHRPSHTRDRIS